MTNTLIHGIINALSGSVSKEVIVFLISMIPILELRGALLVAGPILGVKVSTAIPLCIIAVDTFTPRIGPATRSAPRSSGCRTNPRSESVYCDTVVYYRKYNSGSFHFTSDHTGV